MLFILPIPATYEAIERPAVFQVVKQLINERLIPNLPRIVYRGGIEQVKQKGSENEDCPGGSRFDIDGYISVESKAKYIDVPNALQIDYRDYPPILQDVARAIRLTPVYRNVEMTLDISMTTTSLSFLRDYQKIIRHLHASGRQTGEHDLEYHYTLPFKTWPFLSDLHRLMQDDLTLMEWFKANASNRATVMGSGTHYEVAFKEKQVGVTGTVTAMPDDIGQSDATGNYRTTMSYVIRYQIPDTLAFQYPVMIDQQVIPDIYVPEPPVLHPWYYFDTPLANVPCPTIKEKAIIRVPEFDQEVITQYPSRYHPIVTVLLTLSSEDDRDCFNLRELGSASINRGLLEVFKRNENYSRLVKPYDSPFALMLHRGTELMDTGLLTIDSELNVRLTTSLNNKGVYRVSLCVLSDPRMLNKRYLSWVTKDCLFKYLYSSLITFYQTGAPQYKRGTPSLVEKVSQRDTNRCPLTDEEKEWVDFPLVKLRASGSLLKTVQSTWTTVNRLS